MTDEQFGVQHYLFERMNRAITYCPVPIICAANGSAVAGGLELLLACDFAYAAKSAVFGFTEVKHGIMPGGGTQQLPRTIGARRAKELIFRGSKFSAEEALAWGVVNRLCEPGRVLADAIDAARDICPSAPLSVAQAKKAIDLGMQGDLRTGLYLEIEAYNRLIPTEDRLESISIQRKAVAALQRPLTQHTTADLSPGLTGGDRHDPQHRQLRQAESRSHVRQDHAQAHTVPVPVLCVRVSGSHQHRYRAARHEARCRLQ